MHVLVHLSRYYDWPPVPADTVLTPADIAGPLVMPGREPGTYRMRVEKDGPTTRLMTIKESDLVSQIVDEKVDVRRSGQIIDRKQAVTKTVKTLLDDGRYAHALWSWVTKIEVRDDGPDAATFDAVIEPHKTATHGRTGRPHFTPDEVESARAAYHSPATADDHVAHLHAHFGVSK